MTQPHWRLLSAVNLLIMAIIFAVSALLGGCDTQLELANGNMTFMKCHWAFVGGSFLAVVGFAAALLMGFSKEAQAKRFLAIVLLVAYALVALIITDAGIGICASSEMDCNLTALITWIACVAGAILTILQIIRADAEAAEKPKMQL